MSEQPLVLLKTSAQLRKEAEERLAAAKKAQSSTSESLPPIAAETATEQIQTAMSLQEKAKQDMARQAEQRRQNRERLRLQREAAAKREEEANRQQEEIRRRAAEQLRLEAKKNQQETIQTITFDAQETAQEAQQQQASINQYRTEITKLKADEAKEQAFEAVREREGLATIQKEFEERDKLLPTSATENLAFEKAEADSTLTPEKQRRVEAWLSKVNPLSAKTRQTLQDAIDQLKQSLSSSDSTKGEAIQQQIQEMEEELKNISDSESDINASLEQFLSLGPRALDFVTDFMKNFWNFLRQKMQRVISMIYTIFVQMVPNIAASISNAITEPLRLLLKKLWSATKWVGEKVGVFSDGIVTASRWLRQKGGEITSSTWNQLKEFYGKAGETTSNVSAWFNANANLVWARAKQAGGAVKYAAVYLVDGLWKMATSPKTLLILGAITKYVNSIWNDPVWAKFIIEVFKAARSTICEKMSNYFYTADYIEVDASTKALEAFNSTTGKAMDLGTWAIWNGSTNWLTGGGLKDTVMRAGQGFAQGLKENISAKSLLGAVPVLGGAGAIFGAAIDSAMAGMADESVKAMAESAELAAQVSKKQALLLEHWDFWVNFFTEDCVYARQYTYNPQGWTRSTVDFLTGGWFSKAGQDEQGNRKPPLTKEHIDLEQNLKKLTNEILPQEESKLEVLRTQRTTGNWKIQFPGLTERQFDEQVLVPQQVLVNDTRKLINSGQLRTVQLLKEATERQHNAETGKKTGKGLWNALGLPNTVRDASKMVLPAALDQWVFIQSDLDAKINDENLRQYLDTYNKLVDKTQNDRKEISRQLDVTTALLTKQMEDLKAQQSKENSGSWNPLDWVAGSSDINKYSTEAQNLAKAIQATNAKLDNLNKEAERLDNAYLDLLIKLNEKGQTGASVTEEEVAQAVKTLESRTTK